MGGPCLQHLQILHTCLLHVNWVCKKGTTHAALCASASPGSPSACLDPLAPLGSPAALHRPVNANIWVVVNRQSESQRLAKTQKEAAEALEHINHERAHLCPRLLHPVFWYRPPAVLTECQAPTSSSPLAPAAPPASSRWATGGHTAHPIWHVCDVHAVCCACCGWRARLLCLGYTPLPSCSLQTQAARLAPKWGRAVSTPPSPAPAAPAPAAPAAGNVPAAAGSESALPACS